MCDGQPGRGGGERGAEQGVRAEVGTSEPRLPRMRLIFQVQPP